MGMWGSQGSGDGQFATPDGIAVDADGSVYVTEYVNDRIQKFTREHFFANGVHSVRVMVNFIIREV